MSGSPYFSINGGNTDIVGFNRDPNGDFGDWLSESSPQQHPYAQNAFSCAGQSSDVTATSPEGINLDVEVEKANPDLVTRDARGKVYTVRYEAVNAMLLNEFLKEHRTVEEQKKTITELKSIVGRQQAAISQQQRQLQSTAAQRQQEIQALAARLKEQESQIHKVGDQLETHKTAAQLVNNSQ